MGQRARSKKKPDADGDFLAATLPKRRRVGGEHGDACTEGKDELERMLEEVLDEAELLQARQLLRMDNEDLEVEQAEDEELEQAGAAEEPGDEDKDDVPDGEVLEVDNPQDEADGEELGLPREILKRQEALRVYRQHDQHLLCTQLGIRFAQLREGAGTAWDTLEEPHRELGRVVVTFNRSAVSIVCRAHPNCKLILPVKQTLGLGLPELHCDALLWLAAGSVSTADDHRDLCRWTKAELYQMRVR